MKYTEVSFTINPVDPCRDLLVDALGNEGPYDSFVETSDGLKAYVPTSQFDIVWLQQQVEGLHDFATIEYSHAEMPDKNWNEEWEKQHKPVLVNAEY
jgi:ribosomal protein L11 methyltransferase